MRTLAISIVLASLLGGAVHGYLSRPEPTRAMCAQWERERVSDNEWVETCLSWTRR